MALGRDARSSIGTVLGIAFVIIAVVGTQFLGWEWGSGQPLPTAIGIVAAGIALVVVIVRLLR
nr:multidrug transporter [Halostagnicola sp. A56]